MIGRVLGDGLPGYDQADEQGHEDVFKGFVTPARNLSGLSLAGTRAARQNRNTAVSSFITVSIIRKALVVVGLS
jgi:hypothetical protein